MIKFSTKPLLLGAGAALLLSGTVAMKSQAAPPAGKEELKITYPAPGYKGTPKNIPPGSTAERPTGKPRAPIYVPTGTVNLSKGKAVTASDDMPIIGTLNMITDGKMTADEGSYVELGPGQQWAQVDLKQAATIYSVLVWFDHTEAKVVRDVVVKVADDPDFIENVRTLFNNDQDNSSGQGLGKDREFFETNEGKYIAVNGVKARYLRVYSKGSTSDDLNRFTEIAVFGKPAS